MAPARASTAASDAGAASGVSAAISTPAASSRLVVLTRAVDDVSPWGFLRAGAGEPRGFWARDERWVAHRGVVQALSAAGAGRFAEIRRAIDMSLPAAPEGVRVRLYGGFAFRGDAAPIEHWSGFEPALFHLPMLELTGDATGRGRLRAQAVASDHEVEAVRARLEALLERAMGDLRDGEPPAHESPIPGRLSASLREAWDEGVDGVLAAVAARHLSKAVLARTADVELRGRIAPTALTEALWRRNPGTHVFFFEPVPGRALVGAAPEALATVRAGVFHATAVAGSVARGTDDQADRWLARQLLDSRKDRAEHALVVDDMVTRLARLAHDIRTPSAPSVLRLERIQHLETDVRARLDEGRHVLDLVQALHPTPAVCGVPRDEALDLLHQLEPFERGWYAGPVGWLSTDGDGHFVPALRTAVGDGRRWRLYAGAGIVDGSTPQAEWDETGIKFQPVLRALAACGAALEAAPGTSASRA